MRNYLDIGKPIAWARRPGWNSDTTRTYGKRPRHAEVETFFFRDHQREIIAIRPHELFRHETLLALFGSSEAILSTFPWSRDAESYSLGCVAGSLTSLARFRSLHGPSWKPEEHGFRLHRGVWQRVTLQLEQRRPQ